ncbi:MAG: efflux RND transporter periplasmic adaptor subunit [Treponema sp.]|nr:efflux RND transporter periplasmic adaptor subunit [Treponema sp.]
MKIKKSAIIAVLVIIAAIAVVFYAINSAKNTTRGRSQLTAKTTFSVKTQVAAETTLHDYVSTNGEVEAQSSIEVFPDMGGKIEDIYVSLGSPVKKGEIIARVDPSEPGSKYALSPVYAPISGSIVSTPLKKGETVTTSSSITTIGDIDNLQVTADIPERYVALLKTGLKADISLEAYPSVVFTATVSRVSPVVDASSRTKEVILTFDKKDARINAGMFAKVVLYTVDYTGCVTIPADSIVTKDGKQVAFVVKNDSTVEQRELTLGKAVDGITQVVTGIDPGDKVVVEGMMVLSDGSAVNDISAAAAANSEAASE